MKLPEDVYLTTAPSVEEQEALNSGISTDLVAPAPSSLSHYYQEPNYEHHQQYFNQHAPLNPFLYNGPLIMMMHHYEPQNDQRDTDKSTERNSQNQEESSYGSYNPNREVNPQSIDMLPPSINQEEPNYYAAKPRKSKKYSASEEKKKYKKLNSGDHKEKIVRLYDYDDYETDHESNDYPLSTQSNGETVANIPNVADSSESSREQRDTKQLGDEEQNEEAEETPVAQSAPASRLDFQMHGKLN